LVVVGQLKKSERSDLFEEKAEGLPSSQSSP